MLLSEVGICVKLGKVSENHIVAELVLLLQERSRSVSTVMDVAAQWSFSANRTDDNADIIGDRSRHKH